MGAAGFHITAVNCSNTKFLKQLKKLDTVVLGQAVEAIARLPRQESYPENWHVHPLKGKLVSSAVERGKKVPVWSLHLTSDKQFKASFTVEGGTAYMRVCGTHSEIDDNP